MPVYMVPHVAGGRKPLVTELTTKRFLSSVQLEVIFEASLVAHDASAVSVGTLKADPAVCQHAILT